MGVMKEFFTQAMDKSLTLIRHQVKHNVWIEIESVGVHRE